MPGFCDNILQQVNVEQERKNEIKYIDRSVCCEDCNDVDDDVTKREHLLVRHLST